MGYFKEWGILRNEVFLGRKIQKIHKICSLDFYISFLKFYVMTGIQKEVNVTVFYFLGQLL